MCWRSWPLACLSAAEPLLSLTWTNSTSIYSCELHKISQPTCPINFVAFKKSLLSPTQVYPKVPGKQDTKLNYPYSSLPACLSPKKGQLTFIIKFFGIYVRKRKEIKNRRCWGKIQRTVNITDLTKIVMDRESWPAAIHGVAKSWTRLSDWAEPS